MTNNFQCNKCFHLFTVTNYRMSVKSGVVIYTDKNMNHIKCEMCKSYDVLSLEEEGEYNVNFTKFNSLSDQDKKKILKKRAKQHFDKNTDSIRDQREYIDKNFKGTIKDM